MPVFVRRLFGIGKLPADVRAEVEAEGVIYLADYVPVTRRFSGAIPGLRSAHSVASYVGSLVFTSQRVLATLSSLPKLAGASRRCTLGRNAIRYGHGGDIVERAARRCGCR